MFTILYNPYAKNDNDDFIAVYNRYKADPKATVEINGITFYHALNITQVCSRKCEFVVLLDNRLGLKTNDILVDEAGKEYTVNGFPMIRFISGIPEWYSEISMVVLIGDIDNVGHYFARKETVIHSDI